MNFETTVHVLIVFLHLCVLITYSSGLFCVCVCFKDFIYLFDKRDRSQVGREAGRERGEAGSLPSREPDAGLDPRTLRP